MYDSRGEISVPGTLYYSTSLNRSQCSHPSYLGPRPGSDGSRSYVKDLVRWFGEGTVKWGPDPVLETCVYKDRDLGRQ